MSSIIAAVISLIGMIITIITVKWKLRLQVKDFELKEKSIRLKEQEVQNLIQSKYSELEYMQSTLDSKLAELRQNQLTIIINERVKAYPKLWNIIVKYGTEYYLENKPYNTNWAQNYLNELNLFNRDNGIFFSQQAYNSFHYLKRRLIEINDLGEDITQDIGNSLYDLIINDTYKTKALAAVLKDDLGSYRSSIIQIRKK